jgi:hypothetical protein
MEVSGQFHAPASLPPGKEPSVPTVSESGWAPETVWTLWNREKSLSPAGSRIPAVQSVARRYTDSESWLHAYDSSFLKHVIVVMSMLSIIMNK